MSNESNKPLQVGLVGANPDQSWAKFSHLPALNALPGLELVAVATTKLETAKAGAAAFGVDEYYASAAELAHSEDVEIVSVVVKVPYHAEIVTAALAEGKHVLCEWPLARTVEEAETLVELAARAGADANVHVAVGLQGRLSPAARRARDMVSSGAIGRPLTANIFSATSGFGGQVPSAYAYFDDAASGANLSTIAGGHTLDLAIAILGGIAELDAMGSVQYPTVELVDKGETLARTLPDHLSIAARFESGCALTCEIVGGCAGEAPFTFRVVGTQGQLTLRGGSLFGFQGGELTLESDVEFAAPDASTAPELAGPTANVGELYARFALDIERNEHQTPDFAHALKLQKLIRSVGVAAQSGARQTPDDWPVD